MSRDASELHTPAPSAPPSRDQSMFTRSAPLLPPTTPMARRWANAGVVGAGSTSTRKVKGRKSRPISAWERSAVTVDRGSRAGLRTRSTLRSRGGPIVDAESMQAKLWMAYQPEKDLADQKKVADMARKQVRALKRERMEMEHRLKAMQVKNSALKEKVANMKGRLSNSAAAMASQQSHISKVTSRYGKLAAAMASIEEFGGGAGRATGAGARVLSTDQIFKFSIAALSQDKVELGRKLSDANKLASTSQARVKRLNRELKHLREELSVARSNGGQQHEESDTATMRVSQYPPSLTSMPPAKPHFTATNVQADGFSRADVVPQASAVQVAAAAISLSLGAPGVLGATAGAAAVASTVAHVVAQSGGAPLGPEGASLGVGDDGVVRPSRLLGDSDDGSSVEGGGPACKETKARLPLHHAIEPQMQQLLHQIDMEGSEDQAVQLAVKLRQLLRASVTVAVSMDMADMMEAVALQVCKMVSCNRATIYAVDHVRQMLWSKGAVGVTDLKVPMHGSLAGHVALSGETLHVFNAYADPRFNKKTDRFTGYKTHNMLVMPCWRDGVIVAVVQVINKNGSEQFTDVDEVMLGLLSTHIGIVVGHSQHKVLQDEMVHAQQALLAMPRQLSQVAFADPDVPANIEDVVSHLETHARAVMGSHHSRVFIVEDPHEPNVMRTLLPGMRKPGDKYGVRAVRPASDMWYMGRDVCADGTTNQTRVRVSGRAGIAGDVAESGTPASVHSPYSHTKYNGESDLDTRTLGLFTCPILDSRNRVIAVVQVSKPISLKSEAPPGVPLSQAYLERDRLLLRLLGSFAQTASMPLEYAMAINAQRADAVLRNLPMMRRLFTVWQATQEDRQAHAEAALTAAHDRLAILRQKATTKAADDENVRRLLKAAAAAHRRAREAHVTPAADRRVQAASGEDVRLSTDVKALVTTACGADDAKINARHAHARTMLMMGDNASSGDGDGGGHAHHGGGSSSDVGHHTTEEMVDRFSMAVMEATEATQNLDEAVADVLRRHAEEQAAIIEQEEREAAVAAAEAEAAATAEAAAKGGDATPPVVDEATKLLQESENAVAASKLLVTHPKGGLHVTVVRGDFTKGGDLIGRMDPYVVLVVEAAGAAGALGGHHARHRTPQNRSKAKAREPHTAATRAVDGGGKHVVFHPDQHHAVLEVFLDGVSSVVLDDPTRSVLCVEVWDDDLIGSSLVGHGCLELSDLVQPGQQVQASAGGVAEEGKTTTPAAAGAAPVDVNVDVRGKKHGKVVGTVHLMCEFVAAEAFVGNEAEVKRHHDESVQAAEALLQQARAESSLDVKAKADAPAVGAQPVAMTVGVVSQEEGAAPASHDDGAAPAPPPQEDGRAAVTPQEHAAAAPPQESKVTSPQEDVAPPAKQGEGEAVGRQDDEPAATVLQEGDASAKEEETKGPDPEIAGDVQDAKGSEVTESKAEGSEGTADNDSSADAEVGGPASEEKQGGVEVQEKAGGDVDESKGEQKSGDGELGTADTPDKDAAEGNPSEESTAQGTTGAVDVEDTGSSGAAAQAAVDAADQETSEAGQPGGAGESDDTPGSQQDADADVVSVAAVTEPVTASPTAAAPLVDQDAPADEAPAAPDADAPQGDATTTDVAAGVGAAASVDGGTEQQAPPPAPTPDDSGRLNDLPGGSDAGGEPTAPADAVVVDETSTTAEVVAGTSTPASDEVEGVGVEA